MEEEIVSKLLKKMLSDADEKELEIIRMMLEGYQLIKYKERLSKK
ncbi:MULTISPECIES: hypothetical protein [Kandleria]|jgi:hypothetical protein|uniref:Uncharacterized protein n=1 Tax=Kandleria vitulina TaxID=1630 RepID=A0A1H2UL60_9FIRM|nr:MULTISPECIES: hypothetical protein [Kandleria]MEE0989006.1 hypothetical protein [Kandleria vitulina]SDM13186.1 hypothetical protein SAMN05216520_1278 [Kandleria vitulina]SDW56797.1 hypothetical protein SAMN04487759_12214 [Kandleria vitulina]SEI88485.1 hypothetical protein SAMN05216514_10544 [Kandleria vitulina]